MNAPTDYQIKSAEDSSYSYRRLTANEGTSVALSATAQSQVVFEIPPNTVFNLKESWLQYTFTSAANTNFGHVYANCLPFQSIVLRDQSNKRLLDLNVAHKFFNTVCWDSISYDELKNCDLASNGAGDFNLIRRSMAAATVATGVMAIANNLATNPSIRPDNTPPVVPFDEPAYLLAGADTTATPVLYYKIPFNLIKKCILSQDQNLIHNQTLYLELNFLPTQNYMALSTAIANVGVGAGAQTAGATISSLAMYLALEDNPKIREAVRALYYSSGLKMLVDSPVTFTQSLTTQSQSLSVKLNSAHGIRVKEIYCKPYSATETSTTCFSSDNLADAKVVSFDHYKDDVKINQDLITCTVPINHDYVHMKKHLIGKMMPNNLNVYKYNWFWKYSGAKVGDKNVIEGDDISSKEFKYAIQATTAAVTNKWHVFAICSKPLELRPNEISI